MNRKKTFVMLILVLVGVISFFRYLQINKETQEMGVTKEVFFAQNERVKAPNVEFCVRKTVVKKTDDEIMLTISLFLKQTGTPSYGFKRNNPMFLENMFFNIPYSMSNQTFEAYDKDGKRTPPSKLHLAQQPLTIRFTTPIEEYETRNQKMRFSFLVPDTKHFIKYSLFLE